MGTAFPLSAAKNSNYGSNEIEVSVVDPDGNAVAVANGAFVPSNAGEYEVVYSTINAYGFETKKVYIVTVEDDKTPMTINYKKPSNLLAGDVYKVLAPSISGGNGAVSYKLYLNGEEVRVGEYVQLGSSFAMEVVATDYFGFTETFTQTATVDTQVIAVDTNFPGSAFVGAQFVIPTAKIYSYELNAEVDEYQVYVNGTLVTGASVALPVTPQTMTVEYRTDYGSKTYELNVMKAVTSTTKIEEFLQFNGAGAIYEPGSELTVEAGSKVSFPYMVSSTNLNLEFIIKAEDLTYDRVTFVLTGRSGNQIMIGLDGLLSSPKVTINGVVTPKSFPYTSGVGANNWGEEYKGKTYYAFKMKFDDSYRLIMTGNKPVIEVESYLNGLPFNGFGEGVFVDMILDEAQGTNATICLQKISNQVLGASGFSEGDVIAPEVYSNGCISKKVVEKGFVLDLSSVKGYDVMNGNVEVAITVTGPDRKAVVTSAAPENLSTIVLDKYGVYRINVFLEDGVGNFSNLSYNYTVVDNVPPTLVVNGIKDITAKSGETVKLFDATATDNYEAACKISVMFRNPFAVMEYLVVDAESISGLTYKATIKGTYEVRYIATDANGNVTIASFTMTIN